jgi:hypothetical protein
LRLGRDIIWTSSATYDECKSLSQPWNREGCRKEPNPNNGRIRRINAAPVTAPSQARSGPSSGVFKLQYYLSIGALLYSQGMANT